MLPNLARQADDGWLPGTLCAARAGCGVALDSLLEAFRPYFLLIADREGGAVPRSKEAPPDLGCESFAGTALPTLALARTPEHPGGVASPDPLLPFRNAQFSAFPRYAPLVWGTRSSRFSERAVTLINETTCHDILPAGAGQASTTGSRRSASPATRSGP
jgi:hypothetical protein